MPGERVKVSISAEGYKPVEQTVTAQPAQELVLPFKLEKIAPDPAPAEDPEPEVSAKSDDTKVKKQNRRRGRKPPKSGRKPKQSSKQKAKAKESADKANGTGMLFVKSIPYWGRVQVNGETLDDVTPVRKKLPPGKYKVTVSHPPKGLVKSFSVTIKPGATTTRTVSFD